MYTYIHKTQEKLQSLVGARNTAAMLGAILVLVLVNVTQGHKNQSYDAENLALLHRNKQYFWSVYIVKIAVIF